MKHKKYKKRKARRPLPFSLPFNRKVTSMISVRNITKDYAMGATIVRALSHVSLEVEDGGYIAILGASGSGKSTLMNILGCLDKATEGEYYLDGEDIADFSQDGLSRIRNVKIGFIFQGYNLIPGMTARENVELPLIYRRTPRKEREQLTTSALELVGLGSRMDHRPYELSGGQQQRVAIARAIAAKPSLILADEPCGNLDSKSGKVIMDILSALNRSGRTVVLITHDESAAACAKQVVRIRDGELCG
jgi:putative ABC transport system ATP-binding protein